MVTVERSLLERIRSALVAALTKRGHLAQRVPTEGLGYCSWRSESDRCTTHRGLIEEVDSALERRSG